MNNNSDFKNIAVLVDADNMSPYKVQPVIQKISTYGRIVVKRVYGNWQKENLRSWEEIIKRHAFNPRQQFDYVKGKNATDMLLVIDAMELLYEDRYDAFVIASSDSDYTPLNITLKESGVFVIGVGSKKASDAFKRSCDDYIDLETLDSEKEESPSVEETLEPLPKAQKTKKTKKSEQAIAPEINDSPVVESEAEQTTMTETELHRLLKYVADQESYQDEDGFVNVSSAGAYIKRVRPDYEPKLFGVKKLPEFINKHHELYEVKQYKGKGKAKINAYKCKN